MILAFDTFYSDDKAKTVCLKFNEWTDEVPTEIITDITEIKSDYQPGSFYKRELPCIINVLEKIDLEHIEVIIIDGYVILDDNKKLGLGGYLYEYLQEKIPIVGVAKSNFFENELYKREVLRGESSKPLYITTLGIDVNYATEKVKNMHGDFRFPTLLKLLDKLTKE